MKKWLSGLNIFQKTLIVFIVLVLLFSGLAVFKTLGKIYMPNVTVRDKAEAYINIPTGSTLEDVCNILYTNNLIVNRGSFEWLAEKKKYAGNIKAGRYKLVNRMNNNDLINLLRSGRQEPVRISLNSIRTVNQLAGYVSSHLEADSASIVKMSHDELFLKDVKFNRDNIFAMFIPNTYEFFWNTNAEGFLKRMNTEYHKFWKGKRLAKANEIGLTPEDVITLASIITNETNMESEYPTIAGVYMNRLKRNMPLQADPTIKFVVGNFGIKRVLKKHTCIESPYNTYLNKGIPPGPISMPTIKAINSVLNYEKHSYLYFCAKSDFSGYHSFAKTLIQHNQNAAAYQVELNKKKIYN